MPGVPLQDVWTDIYPVNSQAREATEYATQKPESLLDRIIKASSDPNDLILDCFAGSGTTAERLRHYDISGHHQQQDEFRVVRQHGYFCPQTR